MVRFWSTKPDFNDPETPVAVLTALRDRLDAADATPVGEDEALRFWPRCWDYWGGGIPEPVADYVTSELDAELTSVPVADIP